jgi:hypothetical protein
MRRPHLPRRRSTTFSGDLPRAGGDDAPENGSASEDVEPPTLTGWLRQRATAGAVGNVIVFTLLAATAASRASHGVLSPAALVAVVVGAAMASTATGWVSGYYEGVEAALHDRVRAVRPTRTDGLVGRAPWRAAASWAGWAALWAAAGAVVLAAILRDHSAPFPVLAVALLAIAAPAAVAVDLAARAAGTANGAALRLHRPDPAPLLRRAWRDLALPVALLQAVVNAGVAWILFHGAAADGTLTKGTAFADALVVAALLATVFGALGARWGAVDAASGRGAASRAPRTQAHPVGPQALVYAAGLMLATTSLAGLVVPSIPSLLRVALVRGALAGGLTLVACALGVVRGAANTELLALGDRDAVLAPPVARPRRRPTRRLASLAGASAAIAVLALAATPLVTPQGAGADEFEGVGLVAELDALGVRVEYDIPLPAGIGSIPQVVGTARRTGGGEAANGIAAAPSRLDPVVGGKLSNPDSEPGTGDETALPQAECAYPGALADVAFTFPADLRENAAGTPPLGWSTAQCGAGPAVELHATATSPDRTVALGPAVSVGGVVADGQAGPVEGLLSATASAKASGISILDGLIEVDSVVSSGRSQTTGKPGGGATTATVDVLGVSVAGVRFDVRGGDLVVDGTALPVGGSAASAVLRGISQALAPSGCGISILDTPSAYPQGFLFSRPEPELGVSEDGTLAASMTGGLLVQCDFPQELSQPTGFNPQRMQVMLGFVYTGVTAREDVGGFGLGNIGGGTDEGGTGEGLVTPTGGGLDLPGSVVADPVTPGAPQAPERDAGGAAPSVSRPVTERIQLLAANFAADRPWLWVFALGLWLLLTHRGLERVRRQIAEATA